MEKSAEKITAKVSFTSNEVSFKITNSDKTANWLIKVAAEEQNELSQLDVIFCSDEFLLGINKQYLEHDYYTDIITFPWSEKPASGELYISIDRVQDNAKKLDIDFTQELNRVMVHGVLHLLGYTDNTKESKKLMSAKEDHYLRAFN